MKNRALGAIFSLKCTLYPTFRIGTVEDYFITVFNSGTALPTGVVVQLEFAPGMEYVSSHGPTKAKLENNVVIFAPLASIAPRKAIKWRVKFKMHKVGRQIITASIMTQQLSKPVVKCESTTVFNKAFYKNGKVPALACELIDINDPVDVGDTETYVIRVQNQGNADITGIKIVCDLDDNMKLIKTTGPTDKLELKNQELSFQPLSCLKPRKKATWQVWVRGQRAKKARFQMKVTADQFPIPIIRAESTNFYK